MKKKILYIESGFGFGGAVTCLNKLLFYLDKSTYEPIIVVTHKDKQSWNLLCSKGALYYVPLYQRSEAINNVVSKIPKSLKGIKVVLLTLVAGLEMILAVPFYVRLALIVHKHKPELIHFNNQIKKEEFFLLSLFNLPGVCHLRTAQHSTFLTSFLSIKAEKFIAMSEYIAESLYKLGVERSKVNVIYDGVDVSSCNDMARGFSDLDGLIKKEGEIWVAITGCLLPWKGHDVFLMAAKKVLERGIEVKIKFFIVGDEPGGGSNYKEYLKNLALELGVDKDLVFTGYKENVFPVIKSMDIIVHASIEPEPFGMVIIEAMALGKCVIASDAGGPREIIDNGVDGILINPGDDDLLADTLVDLILDDEKRDSLSLAAADKVQNKFGVNDYKKVFSLYQEMIERKNETNNP